MQFSGFIIGELLSSKMHPKPSNTNQLPDQIVHPYPINKPSPFCKRMTSSLAKSRAISGINGEQFICLWIYLTGQDWPVLRYNTSVEEGTDIEIYTINHLEKQILLPLFGSLTHLILNIIPPYCLIFVLPSFPQDKRIVEAAAFTLA